MHNKLSIEKHKNFERLLRLWCQTERTKNKFYEVNEIFGKEKKAKYRFNAAPAESFSRLTEI